MIKKVHDVLIYQRAYHKDIATRFSPREGFEDLVFTSKTNNPINAVNIKDSSNYIVDRIKIPSSLIRMPLRPQLGSPDNNNSFANA